MTAALAAIEEEGRARLYPPVTDPHWLVLRARREIFGRWLQRIAVPDMRVLDVGGRIQPYRSLIGFPVASYIAIDLRLTPLVDVIADGHRLPFADGQYDLVICTQTLQYAENPFEMIAEVHRVLKAGGHLLLSVPSMYPSDSDSDGWRCYPAAIRGLTRQFAATEFAPEGGTIVGIVRMLNVWIDWLCRPRWLRQILRFSIIPLLNGSGCLLDRTIRTSSISFCANFSVLARK